MFVAICSIDHIDQYIAKRLLFHVRCKIVDRTFHWNNVKASLIEEKEYKGVLTIDADKVNYYVRVKGELINFTMINFNPTMFELVELGLNPVSVFDAEGVVKYLEMI